MISILMINSNDEYVESVVYFDNNGKMKKADVSKLEIKSNSVDFKTKEKLEKLIELEEERKEHDKEDIQDFIDSFGDTNGTENITKDITKTTDNFER